MQDICLDNATIHYEGKWLSKDDLTNMIQDKMRSGDLNFANLAEALEKLNTAMKNTHTIDGVKLVLTREEYKRLKALGGDNEKECLKKAVMAFIGNGGGKKQVKKNTGIKVTPRLKKINGYKTQETLYCIKCNSPITEENDRNRLLNQCHDCIAKNQIDSLTRKNVRYRDHLIG